MNKRKKATFEVKRTKIIKNLFTIIEKEKLDQLQKKSLVKEIEIYKQKNDNLYDQNEKLKQENNIFYSIISFLLKNEEDDFFIKDDSQSIFYKRVLDCIIRFKTLKQKKNKKLDVEDCDLFPQNIDTIEKITNEFENCTLSQLRENLSEKNELIYAFQKKILDLQSDLKEAQDALKENVSSVNTNTETNSFISNLSLDKIPNLIKSLEQERILELNTQIEKSKLKLAEHENLVKEHEILTEKLKENEQSAQSIDSQLRALIEENTKFSNTMKTRLKTIEDKKQAQINELQTKLDEQKEMNFILKSEIVDMQKNISSHLDSNALSQTGDQNSKNINDQLIESLKNELFVLKRNKDVLDFEKKEIFAEKERFKTEKKKNAELEAKLNAEIINLKSEVQNRTNAAAYHKKNFIKIDNEAKYLKNKLKNINGDESHLKRELSDLKQKILIITNENKLLSDDLDTYKCIFKQLLGASSPELIESIEKYRKLLRCPTCDKNYKDTVIDKCMHVLCKECVDNRLKMRSRKCPVCAESFSASDVKRIFL